MSKHPNDLMGRLWTLFEEHEAAGPQELNAIESFVHWAREWLQRNPAMAMEYGELGLSLRFADSSVTPLAAPPQDLQRPSNWAMPVTQPKREMQDRAMPPAKDYPITGQ